MTSYDARGIESRGSSAWERDGCYRAPDHPDGEKFEQQEIERFSNGIIENSLYARLEQALDAASAGD